MVLVVFGFYVPVRLWQDGVRALTFGSDVALHYQLERCSGMVVRASCCVALAWRAGCGWRLDAVLLAFCRCPVCVGFGEGLIKLYESELTSFCVFYNRCLCTSISSETNSPDPSG